MMSAAPHGDPGAHAAAEDDGEHDVVSGARPIDSLRGRETIRVVLDAYVPLKSVQEILLDGLAEKPGGIRSLPQSRTRLQRAWDANADAPFPTGLGFEASDQIANGSDAALIIVPGRIHSRTQNLATIGLHGDRFDFCASPIDADQHVVSLPSIAPLPGDIIALRRKGRTAIFPRATFLSHFPPPMQVSTFFDAQMAHAP
jgi:hypothetical protein